jgi:adenosylhomocysteine nucleosidase
MSMLLRWIVQQYAREAAEGGLRRVVGELQGSLAPTRASDDEPQPGSEESGGEEVGGSLSVRRGRDEATGDEFLPCEAAFIFALGVESGGLVDLLKSAERSKHAHGIEHAGKLNGREVVVVEGGVGQKAAAQATAEVIRFYQPRRVISAGFAGGLVDVLRRGHVLIANEVVNTAAEHIDVDLQVDRDSLAGAKGIHVGRLLTVDRILREPAERRRLAEQQDAIACDMETFAVAQVCRERNVPLAAIRIVSDAVDDELPPEIEALLAQKSMAGKLGAAAGAVLKRFSAAKDLWKLREDALKASDRLAKFLARMLEQMPR